jgi:aminomethyltransferase
MAVRKGDRQVGAVTSGCASPTLGYPIAMAYVEAGACAVGDVRNVELGAAAVDAQVVKLPFYKR